LRKQYGLEGVTTIGLVGSSIWSEKLQMCYGWELVETLRLLRDKPVKGIMIGDGSGIAPLKERCREYGIEEKLLFLGHVAFERLPVYLGLIDVCLSTQSNDIVGQVRTTGKLPLYLAAGRYVLASKVGEAAIVLDEEMLVEYEGVKDLDYPQELAARIENILGRPEMLKRGANNVALAKKHFDYTILARRMDQVIDAALNAENASVANTRNTRGHD
jgi:glycosyltransferase involved in cell wall biosynthesis